MGIPRPDTEEVKEIVENETGLHWTLITDEPDTIELVTEIYKLDIYWDGDNWRFEMYKSGTPTEEPEWALGPIRNATAVKQELPDFIPHEVRV